jgi:translation elongation factor EF-1alpha
MKFFEEFPMSNRNTSGPLRIPIYDIIRDFGMVYLFGKIESGTLKIGNASR